MDDSKEGREKRAKNISKKLKAIQEIRSKQAAGQPLEPEQVRKFGYLSEKLLCYSADVSEFQCMHTLRNFKLLGL